MEYTSAQLPHTVVLDLRHLLSAHELDETSLSYGLVVCGCVHCHHTEHLSVSVVLVARPTTVPVLCSKSPNDCVIGLGIQCALFDAQCCCCMVPRQYRYEPSPEFPLASPCSGIDHHLSGPNRYALTQIFHK